MRSQEKKEIEQRCERYVTTFIDITLPFTKKAMVWFLANCFYLSRWCRSAISTMHSTAQKRLKAKPKKGNRTPIKKGRT